MPEKFMISLRRLLVLAMVITIVVGLAWGQGSQGPKKDIGNKVPLPDTPVPIDKPVGPPQKDKDQLPRVPSLSIDVDVVNVDVVVTDQSGNPIAGLTKANFKVFD